jgi:hypothetical protein
MYAMDECGRCLSDDMQLKPNTRQALDNWLVPTWDSSDGLIDKLAFYNFIDQYQREHGCDFDVSELRSEIKAVADQKNLPFGEHQYMVLQQRLNDMITILDFLKESGR